MGVNPKTARSSEYLVTPTPDTAYRGGMATEWKAREKRVQKEMLRALAGAIRESGMTLDAVASRSDYFTQQQLSGWLNGASAMSVARLVEVCRAIGAPPGEVFARGVAIARREGVIEADQRDELAERRRIAEAEADRIKADEDAGKSALDIADAADHGGDE